MLWVAIDSKGSWAYKLVYRVTAGGLQLQSQSLRIIMTMKVKQIQILSFITANIILNAGVQIVLQGLLVEQVGTWVLSIGRNCQGARGWDLPPSLPPQKFGNCDVIMS